MPLLAHEAFQKDGQTRIWVGEIQYTVGFYTHYCLWPQGQKKAEDRGLFKPRKHQLMDSTREDIDVLNSKYKTEFSTTFESAFKLVAKTEQPKKEPNQGINRTESF